MLYFSCQNTIKVLQFIVYFSCVSRCSYNCLIDIMFMFLAISIRAHKKVFYSLDCFFSKCLSVSLN